MKMKKFAYLLAVGVMIAGISGCGSKNEENINSDANTQVRDNAATGEQQVVQETSNKLIVQFGAAGKSFELHLYDNDTAKAIARHVGSSDWRLPIYNYDNFENWEVMQYYDIPSRYEIPSAPEQITEEKAGTVYYSEPNRIVLFYQDATVSGEYTPVGYFDYSEEFLKAVQENPVLEGWGNKIINISDGE